MLRNKSLNTEQEINKVIKYQDDKLRDMRFPDHLKLDEQIFQSKEILRSLGIEPPSTHTMQSKTQKEIVVPSWDEIYTEADNYVKGECDIEDLFTPEELNQNSDAIRLLNNDFNQIHHLDSMDIAIGAIAGIIGATVDILMVGIPQRTPDGLKAGTLSNLIRDYFDRIFSEEEMEKLANSEASKVPFDAQDNRHTTVYVEGLSAYYHRLLSLGHDPLLGFIFGVADILNGTMTTIDKSGKIVTQVMENYTDRKETEIFAALAKQIAHLKSDVTTSMGLPAPLMSLFNLLQFGEIGEYEQTIAEIVQGMYYEGYDFIHFCSMSVPAMLIDVITRIGYAFKRIGEGHSVKESIPFSLDREQHPKLATMLFMGHSVAAAANTGKIVFSKEPMAVNYAQWIAFVKYSYSQLKWVLLEKPAMREAYVSGKIYDEMNEVYDEVSRTFDDFTREKIVIYS